MAHIPSIQKTLSILRKRLPKEKLKSNLREVIAKRTIFLEDLFESMFTDVVDGVEETFNMPVTYNLPPFEMYATHAFENLSAPDLDHFHFFCEMCP